MRKHIRCKLLLNPLIPFNKAKVPVPEVPDKAVRHSHSGCFRVAEAEDEDTLDQEISFIYIQVFDV
jgi:hypothetical protein